MFANEWQARKDICEVGRRLYDKGFAAANDGNISVRLAPDRILCTPTGVSKGFLKPDDLGIVDLEGKQISGTKKRTSEILLHLSVYKARPDIGGVLHCHPPHATAFAMVHETIPKCVLPEVEVFLGEVPIARYETPGTQIFADTVLPYVHNCNTMLLANHGSVAFSQNIMTAYFNTEIIDAYCRMLILAKQLGPVQYLNEKQVGELLQFKKRLGIDDPRLHMEDCDLCGNSLFREGYDAFTTKSAAFVPPQTENSCAGKPGAKKETETASSDDMEALVQTITAQVLAALGQK
ncbi:class II aldolase/adducin family protein [bacterium]|jgi:L-fuculose-phosphate aldolase|nr:class II aldolase/adducin family protein [bacterium]